jgi:penicillin-binding protein 1A
MLQANRMATDRDAADYAAAPHPRGRRIWFRVLRFTLVAAIWGALALGAALLWFARDLPRPEAALDAVRRPSLTLLDRGGLVIARFGDTVGEPLHLADLPPYLPEAVVAVEDRRFWSHRGFDVFGVARAAWADLRARHVVQGGSTITQQVAKNLFLGNARTLSRKVREVLLTLWLEESFTKSEILEIWLNRVYFGSGAWGIDAAAHVYFGISARRLSLWQAAVLAGLPRAPSRFNPRADPAAAAARARDVLAAMAETGAISPRQAGRAAAEIAFSAVPAPRAGWFAEWSAEQAESTLPPGQDAMLRTTLDGRLQAAVEARLDALLDGPGKPVGASEGAVVVMDAASGKVRAMTGGRDYRASTYNRAVVARRQPGSAFKPFVWLAALERGARPDDMVLDVPIRLGTWTPANFEQSYRGELTLEEALAQSSNVAAVRLLLRAGGARAVAADARRLGITDRLPDNASLALGTGEVGLLELTAAYSAFFNGGRAVTPTGIEVVETDGRKLEAARRPEQQAIDPEIAAMMARMLGAVVARGTGRAAAIAGRAVAGKTGTTQDDRDAWFIGWIGPERAGAAAASGGAVIGVWLGNDHGEPMRGVTGGGLPARLFREIAREVR